MKMYIITKFWLQPEIYIQNICTNLKCEVKCKSRSKRSTYRKLKVDRLAEAQKCDGPYKFENYCLTLPFVHGWMCDSIRHDSTCQSFFHRHGGWLMPPTFASQSLCAAICENTETFTHLCCVRVPCPPWLRCVCLDLKTKLRNPMETRRSQRSPRDTEAT